jgi:phosphoserine phosphatase RsbU/P
MDSIELNPTLETPADTLAVLTEISREINSTLNLDEVLASASSQVKRLIEFEIFAVLLIDDTADNLYFRFAIGHRVEVVEHWRIPLGDGIIGAAASTGQAIRVGDVQKDSRYLAAVEAVRSELAVPLVARGRVIGVMDIESRQPDYFTPAQQKILTLVASRIGTAIVNAQLYESAQKQA